jgi:hypothetical protein
MWRTTACFYGVRQRGADTKAHMVYCRSRLLRLSHQQDLCLASHVLAGSPSHKQCEHSTPQTTIAPALYSPLIKKLTLGLRSEDNINSRASLAQQHNWVSSRHHKRHAGSQSNPGQQMLCGKIVPVYMQTPRSCLATTATTSWASPCDANIHSNHTVRPSGTLPTVP